MNILGQIVIGLMTAVSLLIFIAGSAMSLQNEGGDGAAIGGAIAMVGLMWFGMQDDRQGGQ